MRRIIIDSEASRRRAAGLVRTLEFEPMLIEIKKYVKNRTLVSHPEEWYGKDMGTSRAKPHAPYFNKQVIVALPDGRKFFFNSLAQYARYHYLLLLDKAGAIKSLTLQPKFLLEPGFTRNGKAYLCELYKADFSYINSDGDQVVEDVKCTATVTDFYQSKMKRLLARNEHLVFIEVHRLGRGWRMDLK